MVLAQAKLHGKIGDDEIEYRFQIDTGHVENTTQSNRVPYSFKIPPGLLEKGYVYIIDKFDFVESYRVGNCSLNHKINNDTLEVEAVAKAVKHSSGLWYAAGGWLKGTVIVTLKKTKYIGVDRQPESIISIIDSFKQNIGDSIMTNQGDTYHIGQAGAAGRNARAYNTTFHQYAPEQKQSLAEAAEEIQKLLDQLSQTYSAEEAEQKAAEDLANRAKQDPSFKEKLKNWSHSLLSKGGEVAVSEVVKEGVKRVIPLALTLLV